MYRILYSFQMHSFQRTGPFRKTLVMTQVVRQHPGPGASSLWCIKETPLFKSITLGNPWSMQKPVCIAQPNGWAKKSMSQILQPPRQADSTVRERVSQSVRVSQLDQFTQLSRCVVIHHSEYRTLGQAERHPFHHELDLRYLQKPGKHRCA